MGYKLVLSSPMGYLSISVKISFFQTASSTTPCCVRIRNPTASLDNMTTSKAIATSDSGIVKESGDTQIEYASSLKLGDEKGDYSGATAKTDAREIALVRKLDMRIMPIMWAMYFLNYVGDTNGFALTGLHSNIKIRLIAMRLPMHVSMASRRISGW